MADGEEKKRNQTKEKSEFLSITLEYHKAQSLVHSILQYMVYEYQNIRYNYNSIFLDDMKSNIGWYSRNIIEVSRWPRKKNINQTWEVKEETEGIQMESNTFYRLKIDTNKGC